MVSRLSAGACYCLYRRMQKTWVSSGGGYNEGRMKAGLGLRHCPRKALAPACRGAMASTRKNKC